MKKIVWNPATCDCKNGKNLASIMDVLATMFDEIIEWYDEEDGDDEDKSCDKTNFNQKKATCKTQHFYILLTFLLITTALLIVVTIYCYLIKYWAKKNIYYCFTSQITN